MIEKVEFPNDLERKTLDPYDAVILGQKINEIIDRLNLEPKVYTNFKVELLCGYCLQPLRWQSLDHGDRAYKCVQDDCKKTLMIERLAKTNEQITD